MRPSHDCSYESMCGRPNGALLEKTEIKLKSPLGAPRLTEQSRRHGSSARYIIRDPMTQGYRPGGGCRSCGTVPKKSSRSPGPFLVVSHYTIWTHGHNPSNTFCDPWRQLGAGCCCFLTLTDPLRIQPWSQDRRNQTKSNRESKISMESGQKRTDKEVASKGHRRDKIENINKNTQTVETN